MLGVGHEDVHADGADVLGEGHDQLLADGVDGRIGDLCKLLAEVIEQELGVLVEHGEGRVVAHRRHGLLCAEGHRHDGALHVLAGEPEEGELGSEVVDSAAYPAAAAQCIQFDAALGEPFAIGQGFGQLLLELGVVVDTTFLRIDKEDFAGLQASFFTDTFRRDRDDAGLGGHDHCAVIGDEIACGSQSVAVEHTAGEASVGEEEGRRSVPRLHQDGVIFVERLELLADRVLVVEGFGHKHCHGVGQAQSGHDEKFQHVVQAGRVAHAGLHDGADVAHVAQERGGEYGFACAHPSPVAADGIDFAVVGK